MKNITIYHYSNIANLKKISPKYFGENYFTDNDKKISNINRSFFYTEQKAENLLQNSRYLYICQVKENEIYNLDTDIKGYKQKYNSVTELLYAIKKLYKGVKYNLGYNVICLFYSIKIKSVEALTK